MILSIPEGEKQVRDKGTNGREMLNTSEINQQ
jgi:hypothetical protein